jgi:hypothetical protein
VVNPPSQPEATCCLSDGQRIRVAHVEVWHARSTVCTHVDGGGNGGVGQVEVEVEQGDALK